MQHPYQLKLLEQSLWLSPERCLFWEEEKALIVSDIHFGKSGHFRKEGIGIPQTVFKEDLLRLFAQIQFFKPKQLIVTGDLFHSRMNSEVRLFEKWRNDLPYLTVYLVKGNHDLLDMKWYADHSIHVHPERFQYGPFCFIHEPEINHQKDQHLYHFSGHIHPGIKIEGIAKQSLRFPCFYFGQKQAILPAFGKFTGLHSIKPKKNDLVFAIVDQTIIKL